MLIVNKIMNQLAGSPNCQNSLGNSMKENLRKKTEQHGQYQIAGLNGMQQKMHNQQLIYPLIAIDAELPRLVKEYQYAFAINTANRLIRFNPIQRNG